MYSSQLDNSTNKSAIILPAFLAILLVMLISNSSYCLEMVGMHNMHQRTNENTLTMYYQDIFCAVSANRIFCFTSVCAIVCFVQETDAQDPAIDNHSLWIWQLSTVLCPQYWFWPVGSKAMHSIRYVKHAYATYTSETAAS